MPNKSPTYSLLCLPYSFLCLPSLICLPRLLSLPSLLCLPRLLSLPSLLCLPRLLSLPSLLSLPNAYPYMHHIGMLTPCLFTLRFLCLINTL